MPDATLADFSALVHKVHMREFPLLPQPSWGQDAAYLAFLIDRLVDENERLRTTLAHIAEWDMLTLNTDGTGAVTHDAPAMRRMIADALGTEIDD